MKIYDSFIEKRKKQGGGISFILQTDQRWRLQNPCEWG